MKIKNRIFLSIFLGSFTALILSVIFITRVMYSAMTEELYNEVKNEARFISSALNYFEDDTENAAAYISETGSKNKNRITLCSPDGTVLYDNYADASALDNHSSRPEIAAARENGEGASVRASDTLGEQTFYYAVRLENGSVLRIANTSKSAVGLLAGSLIWIVFTALLIIGISAVGAAVLTGIVIKPVNGLDLDNPASNVTYEELSPLLTRMDKQSERIAAQIEELSRQKNELEYIMENMSEGLVILGTNGNVLSENPSAEKILGTRSEGDYTKLCRDIEYLNAAEKALRGEKSSARLEKNGRVYRIASSPVPGNSKYGALLFITDITEQENAERLRREFSANVSHELKTPLTSIMGASELIENGMAKREDVPRFAEKIHTEAVRLLALIEDIIKISRLDEGGLTREFENVRLDELCREVISELKEKADSKNIALNSDLDEVTIHGVRTVLREMIFNLCDNGIAYNKSGGYVHISLKKTAGGCALKISDNGIGIPEEHRRRIFERFYRVDKSRSKATGGTGLGLSIVKHGAALHNGVITLESEVEKGTDITVVFNKTEQS